MKDLPTAKAGTTWARRQVTETLGHNPQSKISRIVMKTKS